MSDHKGQDTDWPEVLRQYEREKARADAAEASRKSDHTVLLDAWRDRGERVPGKEGSSAIQRVLVGIHDLRERAEQAEAKLAQAARDVLLLTRARDGYCEERRAAYQEAGGWKMRAEKAEAEIAKLREELAAIDAVIARRPALDKPTRRENIEHAINTAKRADQVEAERDAAQEALNRLIAWAEAEMVSLKYQRAFDFAAWIDQGVLPQLRAALAGTEGGK